MKNRIPKVVLAFSLIACAALYLITVPSMPEVIASQFRGDGYARSHMARSFYFPYILVFGIGLPLILAFVISVLPGIRAKWTAKHGAKELQSNVVVPFGWWFATFMALFVAFVHGLVVSANQLDPPRLANGPFLAALVVFVGVTFLSVGYVIARSVRGKR